MVGAPYIDDLRLAATLNAAGIPGVRFLPVRYTPTASVFAGKECGGVQILVTDRDRLQVLDIGLALATTLQRLHPEDLRLARMDRLMGDADTLKAIREARPVAEIRAGWEAGLKAFDVRRNRYLLYR